jgi:hypothetical protein
MYCSRHRQACAERRAAAAAAYAEAAERHRIFWSGVEAKLSPEQWKELQERQKAEASYWLEKSKRDDQAIKDEQKNVARLEASLFAWRTFLLLALGVAVFIIFTMGITNASMGDRAPGREKR